MKTFVRATGLPHLAAVPAKTAAHSGGCGMLPCPALLNPSAGHSPQRRALSLALPRAHRLYRNADSAYGNRDAIIVIITANAACIIKKREINNKT